MLFLSIDSTSRSALRSLFLLALSLTLSASVSCGGQIVYNKMTGLALAKTNGEIVGSKYAFKPNWMLLTTSSIEYNPEEECVVQLEYQTDKSFFLVKTQNKHKGDKIGPGDLVYLVSPENPLMLYDVQQNECKSRPFAQSICDLNLDSIDQADILDKIGNYFDLLGKLDDHMEGSVLNELYMTRVQNEGFNLEWVNKALRNDGQFWKQFLAENQNYSSKHLQMDQLRDSARLIMEDKIFGVVTMLEDDIIPLFIDFLADDSHGDSGRTPHEALSNEHGKIEDASDLRDEFSAPVASDERADLSIVDIKSGQSAKSKASQLASSQDQNKRSSASRILSENETGQAKTTQIDQDEDMFSAKDQASEHSTRDNSEESFTMSSVDRSSPQNSQDQLFADDETESVLTEESSSGFTDEELELSEDSHETASQVSEEDMVRSEKQEVPVQTQNNADSSDRSEDQVKTEEPPVIEGKIHAIRLLVEQLPGLIKAELEALTEQSVQKMDSEEFQSLIQELQKIIQENCEKIFDPALNPRNFLSHYFALVVGPYPDGEIKSQLFSDISRHLSDYEFLTEMILKMGKSMHEIEVDFAGIVMDKVTQKFEEVSGVPLEIGHIDGLFDLRSLEKFLGAVQVILDDHFEEKVYMNVLQEALESATGDVFGQYMEHYAQSDQNKEFEFVWKEIVDVKKLATFLSYDRTILVSSVQESVKLSTFTMARSRLVL